MSNRSRYQNSVPDFAHFLSLSVAHPVSIVLLNRSRAQLCESLVHHSASCRTLRTRLDHKRESVSAPVFFLKY